MINKVFIIEDDIITSYIIKKIVEDNLKNITIEIFGNGNMALAALEDKASLPDLILLDINMPIMDGWEFLEAISSHSIQKTIPIYILSSSIDPDDLEKAKNFEILQGFCSKPFSKAKLEDIILKSFN